MDRKKDLIHEIQSFRKRLSRKLKVERLIVFGSRMKGEHREDSDLDIIIISPNFRAVKFRRRALGFHKYWTLNFPVDFLCFTPEEFEEKKNQISIVREALETGVEV